MADKEARIRIGIDNASQTIADLNKIDGAFRKIGIGLQGVAKLAKDASGAVADIKPFDPKAQTDNLERYRLTLTRMTAAMGLGAKEADYLRARFDAISNSSGFGAEEIAAAAEEYGRLTYDMRGAANNMEGLAVVANNTNRKLGEMVQIGASLHNNLSVPLKDVGKELREIGEIANNAGTRGGRIGLMDMITSLGPSLQKYDSSTAKKRHRLEAFAAGMGGDSPPDVARDKAAAALDWFSGEALGLGKYLGRKSIIDPTTGKIGDPGEILDAVKRKMGRSRNKAAALRVLGNYVSLQGAPAALALTSKEVERLSTTQEEIERKRSEEEYRRHEKQYEEGAWNFIPQPGDMDPMSNLPFLPPAIRERDLSEKDRMSTTPAGALERAKRKGENLRRNMADPLLRGRDAYQQGYEGSRGKQVADETVIQALRDTPVLSIIGDAAHMHTASEAKSRADRIAEQQLLEQRKTNHILERTAGDRNANDVRNRKGRHQ